MRADLLAEPVDGLDEVLAAVDAFDRVLVGGLVRPQPAQAAGLAQLALAVAGSPLASRVAEAAGKAAAGVAGEDHFIALAAARAALLGSVHDALLARAAEAAGRPAAPDGPPAGGPPAGSRPATPQPAPGRLLAARAWLCDLARSGWQGLDNDVVAVSSTVIAAMLPDPALRRLAVLLDGFAAELSASCPGSAVDHFPVRRWADLWTRGMLLTLPGAAGTPVVTPVTGRLLPLGIDLTEHATAVQAQVHAVFEPADGGVSVSTAPRLVRASVSAPKPDTVIGVGVWALLRPRMSLLAAFGEGRAVELAGMPLTDEGDLIWDDSLARPGEPASPFATARVALRAAADPVTAPLDRHPARIAVPVFLEGYAAEDDGTGLAFIVAGHRLPVELGRVPDAGPLTARAVAASAACIGLLRWDAGAFTVQPLAVEGRGKGKAAAAVQAGGWAGGATDKAGAKAEKAASDAMTVLRERAGRLLRK
jgi:hypothetical protein